MRGRGLSGEEGDITDARLARAAIADAHELCDVVPWRTGHGELE